MLNNERAWDDKGTGHVSCAYIERFQGMALIVRSEDEESKSVLPSHCWCFPATNHIFFYEEFVKKIVL